MAWRPLCWKTPIYWVSLDADYAILEVDENVLPRVLQSCQPQYILALNLFRDQLDRYGEVDTISRKWKSAIAPLPAETVVILNGDDPTLCYLGQQLPQQVLFFGLSEPETYLDEIPHAVDSTYCPSAESSWTTRAFTYPIWAIITVPSATFANIS
jgi:UDP-N-acetylmuramyl tripeptide synthase